MRQQDAHTQLRRVRDELNAARFSLVRAAVTRDADTGTPAQRFRGVVTLDGVRRATRNLDRTFTLRLYADFEGVLRDYWRNGMNRLTSPQMSVLIERIGRSLAPQMNEAHLNAAH